MRRRPALTVLLAGLLLLQWGTAFAHCLKLVAPKPGLTVEICTSEGLHRIVLPGPAEEGGNDQTQAACPVCLGPGAAALPTPASDIVSPLRLAQAADPPPPPQPAPLPLPPRSCQPRAPPTS